jgi:drug/metabolite transporter (DMT)-like permease
LSVRDITSSPSRHLFSWFLLISANVLWAASYVAAKFALRDTTVGVMLTLRITIASLVLLPLLLSRRKELQPMRCDIPQLVMLVTEIDKRKVAI